MKVFAEYSSGKAGLIRVWAQSWEAAGWEPQLLSEREVLDAGSARLAAKARGGGLLVDICTINFGLRFRSPASRRAVVFGKRGWADANLVKFPADFTEQQVWDCGRKLC